MFPDGLGELVFALTADATSACHAWGVLADARSRQHPLVVRVGESGRGVEAVFAAKVVEDVAVKGGPLELGRAIESVTGVVDVVGSALWNWLTPVAVVAAAEAGADTLAAAAEAAFAAAAESLSLAAPVELATRRSLPPPVPAPVVWSLSLAEWPFLTLAVSDLASSWLALALEGMARCVESGASVELCERRQGFTLWAVGDAVGVVSLGGAQGKRRGWRLLRMKSVEGADRV